MFRKKCKTYRCNEPQTQRKAFVIIETREITHARETGNIGCGAQCRTNDVQNASSLRSLDAQKKLTKDDSHGCCALIHTHAKQTSYYGEGLKVDFKRLQMQLTLYFRGLSHFSGLNRISAIARRMFALES